MINKKTGRKLTFLGGKLHKLEKRLLNIKTFLVNSEHLVEICFLLLFVLIQILIWVYSGKEIYRFLLITAAIFSISLERVYLSVWRKEKEKSTKTKLAKSLIEVSKKAAKYENELERIERIINKKHHQ